MPAPFLLHVNAWGYLRSATSEMPMIINQPDMTETVTSLVVCCLDIIVFSTKQEPNKCPSTKNIMRLQHFPLEHLLERIVKQQFCLESACKIISAIPICNLKSTFQVQYVHYYFYRHVVDGVVCDLGVKILQRQCPGICKKATHFSLALV